MDRDLEIAAKLKDLRKLKGWSLRELRTQIEIASGERISVSYLSSIERGESAPTVDVLSRIAPAYGVTVKDLVDADSDGQHGQIPDELKLFSLAHPEVSTADLQSLARVEFRGSRPGTVNEWEELYRALESIIGK